MKKVLFSAILIIFALGTVEVSLHLLYFILKRHPFPFRQYDDAIHQIAAPPESPKDDDPLVGGEILGGHNIIEVIHPYLGFVRDPNRTPNTSYLGFPNSGDDPLLEKSNTSVTVAVFGGSFAEGVSMQGRSVMQSKLRDHGFNTRILTLAMGGFKQPQQLLALAYLLSHGAQIDVVVNIDGFNEVALPQAENSPKGVNPFYPRSWYYRILGTHDRATLRQISSVVTLEDARRRWATIFRNMPKFSVIRNVIWWARDKFLERRIEDTNDQIRRSRTRAASRFLTTGPDLGTDDQSTFYQRIANHWKSCSLLMKALSDSWGIAYIHILQPNQYLDAGKTLTEEERQRAFREDHPYRPGVLEGYPRLLTTASDLRDKGVNFHDLTMIYHNIPQTIYIDDCCHPNQLGYEIVAAYVADIIGKVMNSQIAEQGARGDRR